LSRCGQLFKCSCGCPFSTIELLIKHAQLQSHCIPPYNELLRHTNKNSSLDNDDIEPINKKQATQQVKNLKPLKPSLNHHASIIIINNISASSTHPSSTTTTTTPTMSIGNLILNKNNILTTNKINGSEPSGNLFKLPYFEPCQRSLGCQTQLLNDTNKQESACQTPILNIYQSDQQQQQQHQVMTTTESFEIFKYYETQQTQTSRLIDEANNNNNNFNIHHFDASTSPINTFNDDAIINDDQFWAEISTQTVLSAFERNQQQHEQQQGSTLTCDFQTGYTRLVEEEQQHQEQDELQLFNREIQTCDIALNTACTQTSQSTGTSERNNSDLDFLDTIILNSYSTSETQTHEIGVGAGNEEFNVDGFIQTNSIQTQTFDFFVDNITQTPWDLNICNEDLLF
jgi:hypothetical protein